MRYGLRMERRTTGEMYDRTRTAGFGAEVERRIMLGTYALSAGYYDAFYGKAQRVRTLIIRDLDAAYERFDVLVGPTAPSTAFPFGAKTADPLTMYLNDVCTIPSNLSGHPAISIPFGTGDDGLPVGVQVMAPALGEAAMFRAAAAVEAAAPSREDGAEHHHTTRHRDRHGVGDGDRARGPRRARHPDQAVLRLPQPVRRRAQHERVPGVPRAPGFAAGPQRAGGHPGHAARSRPALRGAPVDLRPEELLLSGHAEELPDQPVRPAHQRRGPARAAELGLDRGIERAHIEEDTGKSTHVGGGGRIHDAGYSLVDYNRAGVPLLEIVSKPDLRSADDARAYVSELRAILLATGASDAKMEEGSLRVDANVSIHRPGEPFGTRCEIKNLNSLRSLGRAIEYEARRQIELLESGEPVRQETRHWDEDEGRTGTLRTKEEAEDYRYFPEPDLVPLDPGDEWIARRCRAAHPARRAPQRAGRRGRGRQRPRRRHRRRASTRRPRPRRDRGGRRPARCSPTWSTTSPSRAPRRRSVRPGGAGIDGDGAGELTATQAKAVLAEMVATGDDPAAIAKAKGYEAMDADALAAGRPGHRRQPGAVGPLRGGRGQGHGLLRGRGHEGHQGPGRRQGGDRAAAPAGGCALTTTGGADSDRGEAVACNGCRSASPRASRVLRIASAGVRVAGRTWKARLIDPGEVEATIDLTALAFAVGPRATENYRRQAGLVTEPDRVFVVEDGDVLAGTARASRSRCAARWRDAAARRRGRGRRVARLPATGILRTLMEAVHDQALDRGEPIAGLTASEGTIYRRFGYGVATRFHSLSIDRLGPPRSTCPVTPPRRRRPAARAADPLMSEAEACPLLPAVWDRYWRHVPGEVHDRPVVGVLALDLEEDRDGASARFVAVHDDVERVPDGFVIYRIKRGWGERAPPAARADRRVRRRGRRRHRRRAAAVRARGRSRRHRRMGSLRRSTSRSAGASPALGLRVTRSRRSPVGEAVRRRGLPGGPALRHRGRVRSGGDRPGPPGAGRAFRLEGGPDGADCRRSDAEPDLVVGVADLGALLLGAVSWSTLHRAGLVDERTPGAVTRADGMFRPDRPPYCSTDFCQAPPAQPPDTAGMTATSTPRPTACPARTGRGRCRCPGTG